MATRRALCSPWVIARPDAWIALDTVIAHIKQVRPDFLRADGDYGAWMVRDAATGETLNGFEQWGRIEGMLARRELAHALYWLGLVALDHEPPTLFQVQAVGHALLRGDDLPASVAEESAPHLPAELQDDLLLVIPRANTLYDRYQLERFAEWQTQTHETVTYRITEESIWRSQGEGVSIEQIVHFLTRVCGGNVGAAPLRTLQAWGGHLGRATLRRMVILETVDEHTMQLVVAQPALRRLLGPALNATQCLVPEEAQEQVVQRLKAMGIWPKIVR